jgi:hypothetical protein
MSPPTRIQFLSLRQRVLAQNSLSPFKRAKIPNKRGPSHTNLRTATHRQRPRIHSLRPFWKSGNGWNQTPALISWRFYVRSVRRRSCSGGIAMIYDDHATPRIHPSTYATARSAVASDEAPVETGATYPRGGRICIVLVADTVFTGEALAAWRWIASAMPSDRPACSTRRKARNARDRRAVGG